MDDSHIVIPDGFIVLRKGTSWAIVQGENSAQIASALIDGENCEALPTSGRGIILKFCYGLNCTGIVRRYLRGGAIRFILRDRYILSNRPLKEFLLHHKLLQMDLSVPDLLGVCWRQKGIFYSGALATEQLSGMDLDAWLSHHPDDENDIETLLKKCGRLICQMHNNNVLHADLQVKNIFICGNEPVLLDFDNAKICSVLPSWRRTCNLLRLRRSFDKRGHHRNWFYKICEGYGMTTFPPVLSFLYGVKGVISDMIFGRRNKYT